MRTTGFGRNAPGPQRPGLVLIPDGVAEFPAPFVDLASLSELKERIRTVLMSRIDAGWPAACRALIARGDRPDRQRDCQRERVQLNEREETPLAAELVDDMVGLGPLEPLLTTTTSPISWSTGRPTSLSSGTANSRRPRSASATPPHLVNVAQRIASAVGRRIDEASPMVDARLADGSRVNIVLPPLVLNGGCISIRKFSQAGHHAR